MSATGTLLSARSFGASPCEAGQPCPRSGAQDGDFAVEALSPAQREAWRALQAETDPELLARAALDFAVGLEASGSPSAPAYYRALDDPALSPAIRAQAQRRLAVLAGGGRIGDRIEIRLGGFFHEASDPAMLGAMTAAGLVFRTVRIGTLGRLLARPQAHWLTRGAGASLAAGTAGFLAEVPAFVFARRGLERVLGGDAPAPGLGEDLSRTALHLGLLKGAGAATRGLTRSPLARQAGVLAGIATAQVADQHLGWSPAGDFSSLLFESLATYLHFQAGGRLAQAALGPRFGAWSRELELHAKIQEGGFSKAAVATAPRHAFAAEGIVAGRSGVGVEERPRLPDRFFNFSQESGTGSDLRTVTRRFGEKLAAKLRQDPEAPGLRKLREQVAKTSSAVQEVYGELLLKVSERELERSAADRVENLLLGAGSVFACVSELDPLRRARGSFYDSLVQEAFERSLVERDALALGSLMRVVSQEPGIPALERFFRQREWHRRYGLEVLHAASQEALPAPWRAAVEALPLNKGPVDRVAADLARKLIADYLKAYHARKIAPEFRNPARNAPIAVQKERGPVHQAMDLPVLRRGLVGMFELLRGDPDWGRVLAAAAGQAFRSPVPVLYLDRLFKLTATEGPLEKLGDIAFPKTFALEQARAAFATEAARKDWRAAGAKLNRGFETGFLDDSPFAAKLARFYEDLPNLGSPAEAARRRATFHERAAELLRARAEGNQALGLRTSLSPMHGMDVLDLLDLQPTPLSRRAREAFLKGEVDLQLLSYAQMQDLWLRQEQSRVSKDPALSLFLPAGKSATGRPTVAVVAPAAALTLEEKAHRALRVAGWTVHEFEHYSHHRVLPFQDPAGLLRAEMRASLEELHFLLKNGELSEWERIRLLAPQGLGIYLRSRVEQDYLGEPRLR
ncbi:hypothetical protein FBR05_14860 [Deltaproteobacteria bacterium PRO3]|nr:hypothetical protein [Deltaproteobacteria bacterium PRO3]